MAKVAPLPSPKEERAAGASTANEAGSKDIDDVLVEGRKDVDKGKTNVPSPVLPQAPVTAKAAAPSSRVNYGKHKGTIFIKSLSKVWDAYPLWDASNTLLMDDSPDKCPEIFLKNTVHPPPITGLRPKPEDAGDKAAMEEEKVDANAGAGAVADAAMTAMAEDVAVANGSSIPNAGAARVGDSSTGGAKPKDSAEKATVEEKPNANTGADEDAVAAVPAAAENAVVENGSNPNAVAARGRDGSTGGGQGGENRAGDSRGRRSAAIVGPDKADGTNQRLQAEFFRDLAEFWHAPGCVSYGYRPTVVAAAASPSGGTKGGEGDEQGQGEKDGAAGGDDLYEYLRQRGTGHMGWRGGVGGVSDAVGEDTGRSSGGTSIDDGESGNNGTDTGNSSSGRGSNVDDKEHNGEASHEGK